MTRIQLFNDTLTGSIGFLDVTQDVDIPITLGVAEIRDISKRTGAFSKTITLPGTKNNNELFGYCFDVNLSNGSYNINKLQTCGIINDGQVSVDYAFIQLITVRKKQNIANGDDIVEYDVLIKDTVSNFFTRVGSKELSELPKGSFNPYNFNFNSATIVDSFSNQWSDSGDPNYSPYKYWLPYRDTTIPITGGSSEINGYFISELQPAIFAKFYWDLIHQQAGYTYTWLNQTSDISQFDKLLITDNKSAADTNKLTNEYNTIISRDYETLTLPLMGTIYTSSQNEWLASYKVVCPIFVKEEVRDNLNLLNHYYPSVSNPYPGAIGNTVVTNVPASPSQDGYTIWESGVNLVQSPQRIKIDIANIALQLTNPNSFTVYPQSVSGFNREFQVWIEVFDPVTSTIIAEEQMFSTGNIPGPSFWNLVGYETKSYPSTPSAYSFTTDIITGSIGDVFSFRITVRTVVESPLTGISFYDASSNPVTIDMKVNTQNISLQITPLLVDTIPLDSTVPLSSYIPKKIKQADFIKSIALMYNLYCIPDPANPNNLIWVSRDEFYDDGEVLDWTYKMDRSQWQEIQFLPDLTAKTITLTYKSDTDTANETYLAATKENYGQQKVIFDSDWVKNDESKELIFSPTPFKESIWGGVTPWYNNIDGTHNFRVLFDGPSKPCDLFIVDYLDYTGFPIYTGTLNYNLSIHSNDEIDPTFDINFGICDYYYTDNYNPTIRNLYNLYWKRTMNQIDTSKLMTAYFNLDVLDVSNLKMNEKILINNTYWNINKIIDFNYNKKGLTKVELISIDENLILNIE